MGRRARELRFLGDARLTTGGPLAQLGRRSLWNEAVFKGIGGAIPYKHC